MDKNYSDDWSTFTVKANFNKDPQAVYDAWATQDGLESWFLRTAEFTNENGRLREKGEYFRSGDEYRWLWYGFDDDTVEQGKVLEANGKDTIKFTFSGNTVVEVKVLSIEGHTIIELTQSEIPWEDNPGKNLHVQCTKGWVFYLANLKSVIEGGLDLRNKNVEVLSNFK